MSDRTQDLKNLRAVATACKNYVDATKEQILWQVGQYNITTQDDNTTAYQKVVPTGATRGKLKSIGFMSYKCNNLFNIHTTDTYPYQYESWNSQPVRGNATNTYVENDTINCNSRVGTISYLGFKVNFTKPGTYIVAFDKDNTNRSCFSILNKTDMAMVLYREAITTSGKITVTFTIDDLSKEYYLGFTNYSSNSILSNIMLNEGSTALPYEPYFENIRDSIVTKVYSRKSALRDLRLTQIGAYTFTGNETLIEYTRSNDNKKTYACAINGRATTTDVFFENLSLSTATTMNNMEDNSYRGATDTTSVIFYSTSYQTSASMLTFLIGKTIYYKLATELETPQQAVVDYFVIDTITIPDEVKALNGYGRGINENCYNVLDLESKVFTDKDNLVDLGTLDYNYGETSATPGFNTPKPTDAKSNSLNGLCSIYDVEANWWNTPDNYFKIYIGANNINVGDSRYTDTTIYKTAMNGINFQYELETYNITDNLELPNNVIEVEEGGYLVFENQYQQAVPSNVTYRIEVAR